MNLLEARLDKSGLNLAILRPDGYLQTCVCPMEKDGYTKTYLVRFSAEALEWLVETLNESMGVDCGG